MMKYTGIIKKSRTLDKETLVLLAGFAGVVQEHLPLIQDTLGKNYGWAFIGFALVGYYLRFKTTAPVGEK